jgi:glycosyltransferase involved in cell wall biosynthesis
MQNKEIEEIFNSSPVKVLCFGHLPVQYGGLQNSGLAMAQFELIDAINRNHRNIKVILASTDWFKSNGTVQNTDILGWNRKLLLKHIAFHPFSNIYYFGVALFLFIRYKKPIIKNWMYMSFYDLCISATSPDMLHLDGVWRALLGHFLLHTKSINKIVRIHGMLGYDKAIPGYLNWRKVEKSITDFPNNKYTFVTKELLTDWQLKYGDLKRRGEYVLNGVNTEIFFFKSSHNRRMSPKKLLLLTIGRLSELKGQSRVIKAIARLDRLESISYTCIGPGDSTELIKLANEMGIDLKVYNDMSQSELVKYIRKADFMILPSSSEGFGMVLTESIACGTPVILPATIPIAKEKEIISENNSILIDDYSVASIETGIVKALAANFDNLEVANSVNHLSWNDISAKYADLITKLVEK